MTTESTSDQRAPRDERCRTVSVLCLIFLYTVLAGGIVLSATFGLADLIGLEWALSDQAEHIAQIDFLIRHPLDIFSYPATSATTPGFHLLIASIAGIAGLDAVDGHPWLRAVPFAFGLATLAILWRLLTELTGYSRRAALLSLPLLLSKYFLVPSVLLSTETCAYFGYVFLLLAYLRFPERGVAIGIIGAGLMLARQIFLPVILAHPFAFWRARARDWDTPRYIRTVAIAALPPLAIVAIFILAWHGLVPPGADTRIHQAASFPNLDPVIEAWALLGLLAVPFGLLALPDLRRLQSRRAIHLLTGGVAVGLLLWLVAPSAYDLEAGVNATPGRWGSAVWFIARYSPEIGERAILVLPCLVLGFTAAAAMIEIAWARGKFPAELLMFLAYVLALSVQSYSFQRYTEVPALLTLSVAAARLSPPGAVAAGLFVAAFALKLPLSLLMHGAG